MEPNFHLLMYHNKSENGSFYPFTSHHWYKIFNTSLYNISKKLDLIDSNLKNVPEKLDSMVLNTSDILINKIYKDFLSNVTKPLDQLRSDFKNMSEKVDLLDQNIKNLSILIENFKDMSEKIQYYYQNEKIMSSFVDTLTNISNRLYLFEKNNDSIKNDISKTNDTFINMTTTTTTIILNMTNETFINQTTIKSVLTTKRPRQTLNRSQIEYLRKKWMARVSTTPLPNVIMHDKQEDNITMPSSTPNKSSIINEMKGTNEIPNSATLKPNSITSTSTKPIVISTQVLTQEKISTLAPPFVYENFTGPSLEYRYKNNGITKLFF